MMNLLTLPGVSSFSDEASQIIKQRLAPYGLYEENVLIFDTPEALLDEAALEFTEGKDVVLAIEPEMYNTLKRRLSGQLVLTEEASPAISESIALLMSSEYFAEPIDMESHSIVPSDSLIFLSNDGLYSGFGIIGARANHLYYLPLDYSRIDSVLDQLIQVVFSTPDLNLSKRETKVDHSGFDFSRPVCDLVYAMVQLDKRVAFCDSEAIDYIKPLTDKVEGFGAVAYFVRDENTLDEDEEQAQVNTVRKAREALSKTDADFGVAISGLVLTQQDESNSYSVFVAIADHNAAKIKKISTEKTGDVDILLAHAITIMIDTLCHRAEELSGLNLYGGNNLDDDSSQNKEVNKNMIIIAILVALIAIGTAIFFVVTALKEDEPSTGGPSFSNFNSTSGFNFYETTAPGSPSSDSSAPTSNPQSELTVASLPTVDANYDQPVEPTAGQVSMPQTSPTTPSSSGTFTFHVFGYGHGVGLSQAGAEYYAKLGWNYSEILANYYYGTTLVIGDSYPDKITYSGTVYSTREYLATALESEMGASFSMEALKAQTVALFTYAKYYGFNVSSSGHAFGKMPSSQAYNAVDAVIGTYLTYNGSTALTPFHAISAGKTTSYFNVWGATNISYLSGGRPSYGDYQAKDFHTYYSISSNDLKALVKTNCNIDLTGDPATWLTVISHDACIDQTTGYVYSVSVGGTPYTGYKFRTEVLGNLIRSHCFKILYTPNS